MADGWIAVLVILGLFAVVMITSIIVGAVERIAKYRVDRETESRLRGP